MQRAGCQNHGNGFNACVWKSPPADGGYGNRCSCGGGGGGGGGGGYRGGGFVAKPLSGISHLLLAALASLVRPLIETWNVTGIVFWNKVEANLLKVRKPHQSRHSFFGKHVQLLWRHVSPAPPPPNRFRRRRRLPSASPQVSQGRHRRRRRFQSCRWAPI